MLYNYVYLYKCVCITSICTLYEEYEIWYNLSLYGIGVQKFKKKTKIAVEFRPLDDH